MESQAIQRKGAITTREVDGELLVLDRDSNQVHQLNRTASLIWRMTDQGAAPQATASTLASLFDIDEATALEDVLRTLASLRAMGLLGALPGEC